MAEMPTFGDPIRVLHVCDKFGVEGSSVHGVSRLFSWWFPRFDASRYDVRLVGLRRADQATGALRAQGIDVTVLDKGKFDASTLPALVGQIRRLRADIVHLHGYGASNFGRMAAGLTGAKTIVHEHFVDPAMPAYQIPFDRSLARRTDQGIAVSSSVRQFMIQRRFMPEDKVCVIYNGAPLQEFRPLGGEAASEQRRRWNIPEGRRVVAAIGRLDEQKGNRYLIEAAAHLLRRGHRMAVVLVGDGPLANELTAQRGALGIDSSVVFTGFQSDIQAIQSMVDIQVFPSLWEGTPLTVFEAMASGRAIVATGVDGLGEVLRDRHNALLVPPRNAYALAAAIEELLTDSGTAKRLAAQALADSRQFDIQRTVEQLQAVYEALAGTTTPSPGTVRRRPRAPVGGGARVGVA